MPKEKAQKIQSKREERQKQTAEVFTPPLLVSQMLSKLPKEVWRKNKSFLDPACGNGNFLVFVLLKKLSRGHNSLEALKTVHGVDVMVDNIRECRERLLKAVSLFDTITRDHVYTVMRNVVYINLKKHPGGSLDYDFSFNNGIKDSDIDRWMENMDKHLSSVDLPVNEANFAGCTKDLFEDKYDDSSIESPVPEALSRSR